MEWMKVGPASESKRYVLVVEENSMNLLLATHKGLTSWRE